MRIQTGFFHNFCVQLEAMVGASRFRRNISIGVITRGVVIVFNLITSVLTARYLGPAGKGILAVVTTVNGVALQFGNLGLGSASTYFVANDRNLISRVFAILVYSSVFIGGVVSISVLITTWAFPGFLGEVPRLLLWIGLAPLVFQFFLLFGQSLLMGLEQFNRVYLLDILNSSLIVGVGLVVLVWLRAGIASYFIFSSILAILMGVLALGFVRSYHGMVREFDDILFKRMMGYSAKAYIATLLSFLVLRSDIFMVNYYLGVDDVGVYSIAVRFGDVLYILPTTIGMVLFPKVASMNTDSWRFTLRVLAVTAFMMLGICGMAAFLSSPLILLLFGQPFMGAREAFLWLLPGIWCLSLSTVIMNFFAGKGMPVITVVTPLVAFLLNIVVNLILIPRYGIVGASLSSTAAYSLWLVLNFVYARSRYGNVAIA